MKHKTTKQGGLMYNGISVFTRLGELENTLGVKLILNEGRYTYTKTPVFGRGFTDREKDLLTQELEYLIKKANVLERVYGGKTPENKGIWGTGTLNDLTGDNEPAYRIPHCPPLSKAGLWDSVDSKIPPPPWAKKKTYFCGVMIKDKFYNYMKIWGINNKPFKNLLYKLSIAVPSRSTPIVFYYIKKAALPLRDIEKEAPSTWKVFINDPKIAEKMLQKLINNEDNKVYMIRNANYTFAKPKPKLRVVKEEK